jgi:hypothetical protein
MEFIIEKTTHWHQPSLRILNNFNGTCLFCDCDFVFLKDPNLLLEYKSNFPISVVKHKDYIPKSEIKMDGKVQSTYPRKNWSSLILWDCSHSSNLKLMPDVVNTCDAKYLHRFEWLSDDEIGELPYNWNWLVGYYEETDLNKPYALHYTDGGPWFEEYKNCEYSEIYIKYRDL